MPDLIRHPVPFWIPAFARMTVLTYLSASLIKTDFLDHVVKEAFLQKEDRSMVLVD